VSDGREADGSAVGMRLAFDQLLLYRITLARIGEPFDAVAHLSVEEVPGGVAVFVFTGEVCHGKQVFRLDAINQELKGHAGQETSRF